MQIPKPLPTPCISLVAGVDVVAHVVEDEVAEVGEEVVVGERRDGEDLLGSAMIWNGGKKPYEAAARLDVCLTI